jgi:hypothetical protein
MWANHPVYKQYRVSNNGFVRHVNSKSNRATRADRYGYERLNIGFNGEHKTVFVHRLVAECFIPNPKNLKSINHIDGDKLNNKVENLEWMTIEDNVSDSYNRQHSKCKPIEIDGRKYRSLREAERETGISRFELARGY